MSGQLGFGDRLAQAMSQHGPLCVGVDPHSALLQAWGLPDDVRGVAEFSQLVLEAAGSRVAALKPQVAFYERFGAAGLAVLEELIAECARRDVLVIADAKRGDIGSTMKAYADAWLGGSSSLTTDSVTLSPYLGFESLRPALDIAAVKGKGTFVLALTSNPEGQSVQHVGGEESVAAGIVAAARAENDSQSWNNMGSCGLVVGATVGEALKKLRIDLSTFNGPILSPGYGAQGATAEDLYRVFEGVEEKVVVNSSRGVLQNGPSVEGLVDAIESTTADLRRVYQFEA